MLHRQPEIGSEIARQVVCQDLDRPIGVLVEDRADDFAMFTDYFEFECHDTRMMQPFRPIRCYAVHIIRTALGRN